LTSRGLTLTGLARDNAIGPGVGRTIGITIGGDASKLHAWSARRSRPPRCPGAGSPVCTGMESALHFAPGRSAEIRGARVRARRAVRCRRGAGSRASRYTESLLVAMDDVASGRERRGRRGSAGPRLPASRRGRSLLAKISGCSMAPVARISRPVRTVPEALAGLGNSACRFSSRGHDMVVVAGDGEGTG